MSSPEEETRQQQQDPLTSTVFDYLIYGTGLQQSFLAKELSERGYAVIHVDKQPFYGDSDATLSLPEFMAWLYQNREFHKYQEAQVNNEDNKCTNDNIIDLEMHNTTECPEEVSSNPDILRYYETMYPDFSTVYEDFDNLPENIYRSCKTTLIDLCPRVTLSRGTMVDTLVESNMDEYCEFKAFDTSLTVTASSSTEGAIELAKVPSSKSDIFSSKSLALIEKRQLMKLLQYMIDYGSYIDGIHNVKITNEGYLGKGRSLARPQNKGEIDESVDYTEKDVDSFLKHFGLSDKLRKLVLHVMAFLPFEDSYQDVETTSFKELLRKLIRAMGRFGGSGFILTRYGTGDLPQAFCRKAAVRGTIYVLGFCLQQLTKSEDLYYAKAKDGTLIKARKAILPAHYLRAVHLKESIPCRVMGVAIMRKSLLDILPGLAEFSEENIKQGDLGDTTFSNTGKERHVLTIPPNCPTFDNPASIFIYQQDASCEVVPQQYYLVYLISGSMDISSAKTCLEVFRKVTTSWNDQISGDCERNVVWYAGWVRRLFSPGPPRSLHTFFCDTSPSCSQRNCVQCTLASMHFTDTPLEQANWILKDILEKEGGQKRTGPESQEEEGAVIASVYTGGFDALDELSLGSDDDEV